ncbi:uncharacterized protein AB675_10852 [Cyphellophora attinorum]|uniref:LYR motif-containing protein Cup1-like N-terminal domain-containing protein n=1 Tax=Cyphellophora attinorum TaxID=1664694 RepID=A0A0N1HA11_9EURO|nr:uncharacterized protein AB675_10852 [Phialophora attinorum]KPI40676.1 hypothetical protein AB675_10852 [Phialophora attinorum]
MKTLFHFNPIHIYRSILRQATYHPDPRARLWLTNYAVSSFHDAKHNLKTGLKRMCDLDRRSRETALLSRARKFATLLTKANNGSVEKFRQTLDLVYGRKGPRRYELMEDILRPPIAKQELGDDGATPVPLPDAFNPSPAFTALAKSQSQHERFVLRHAPPLRHKGPAAMPEVTIWGRPIPANQVARHTSKWYAREASILLPPLPSEDWHYVRAVATGEMALRWPVRRKCALHQTLDDNSDEAATSAGGNITDDQSKRPRKIDFLAPLNRTYISDSTRRGADRTPHIATARSKRWIRRQYAYLLRHTPLASQRPMPDQPSLPTLSEADHDGERGADNKQEGAVTTKDNTPIDRTKKEKGNATSSRAPKPTYLWEDALNRTTFVRERVKDGRARKLLFG